MAAADGAGDQWDEHCRASSRQQQQLGRGQHRPSALGTAASQRPAALADRYPSCGSKEEGVLCRGIEVLWHQHLFRVMTGRPPGANQPPYCCLCRFPRTGAATVMPPSSSAGCRWWHSAASASACLGSTRCLASVTNTTALPTPCVGGRGRTAAAELRSSSKRVWRQQQ